MSNLDAFKEKIKSGGTPLGVFVNLADPAVSEIVGYAGYDFAWIDAEHSAMDRQEIFRHVIAAQGAGAAAFVRVPGIDPTQVKAILDMGPDGIIFPFVSTKELAELAVKSCLYPPAGLRGQGPLRAIKYGLDDEEAYIADSSSRVWKILQIENVEGYDNLDSIAAVAGYDSLFVGPADLSRSLALPPQARKEKMTEILDDMGKRLKAKGVVMGTATGSNPDDVKASMARGFGWVVVAQDVRAISLTLRDGLRRIRSSLAERS